ncbi:MAG: glutaredoxin domain-containing protein [Ornithinimicrobium sp.]
MTSEPKTPTDHTPDDGVVIYWRPGCGFCARLRSTLGAEGDKATWINIWEDEDAAAFVRSVNDGNETVPTVVLDGIPVTNPSPVLVQEKLAS